MAEMVKKEYETSLADLSFNSKPLINMLTMLAEENVKFAPQIVEVIEARLQKAKPSEKLPVLYLVDSIIKNMKGSYLEAFTPNIVQTFCGVFEKVDEKTRQSLFKLRMTWSNFFSPKKLYALDLKVKLLDPAWPVIADPTTSQPAAIHVNPKFIKKTPVSTSQASIPVAPAAAVPLTAEQEMELKKKESERQEMEMRQQLIKKQEQLLQLQQKRLEFELQQTQSKLEEQAVELKQKNEQLRLQKQVLQHQAAKQQQQQAVAWTPPLPAPPQPPVWSGGPVMPGGPPPMPGGPLAMPGGPLAMPGGPPTMPGASLVMRHPQQQSGFPPILPAFSNMPMQGLGQPPMQPVLPMPQVPLIKQVPASANRDPRVIRDPRLARRDVRLQRGDKDQPDPKTETVPIVATVPPVQSQPKPSVKSSSTPPTLLTNTQSTPAPRLKCAIVAPPNEILSTTNIARHEDVIDLCRDSTSETDLISNRDEKATDKTTAKSQDDTNNMTDTKTKIGMPPLSQEKSKASNVIKPMKSRRSSDDSAGREKDSCELEHGTTGKGLKKQTDKRESWTNRDGRDRLKERSSSRETSQLGNRWKPNRSRSRSRSPRGYHSASRRSRKVDEFGRDMPRPVKETKDEKKPESDRKMADDRVKPRHGTKDDNEMQPPGKSEKRRSTSKSEAPSKRLRMDDNVPMVELKDKARKTKDSRIDEPGSDEPRPDEPRPDEPRPNDHKPVDPKVGDQKLNDIKLEDRSHRMSNECRSEKIRIDDCVPDDDRLRNWRPKVSKHDSSTHDDRRAEHRSPDDRRLDDRRLDDRRPEDRRPEDRRPDDRRPEDRLPEDRRPDDRRPENRLPEDRLPEDRRSDDRRPDDRRPDDRRPDDRRPEDRRPDDRRPDDRRPAAREAEACEPIAREPDARRPDDRKPDERRPDEQRPDEQRPDEQRPDDRSSDDRRSDDRRSNDRRSDDRRPDDERYERTDPDRMYHERMDRDRERRDLERRDRECGDHGGMDRDKVSCDGMDRNRTDRDRIDRDRPDRNRPDRDQSDRNRTNRGRMDRGRMDRGRMDHGRMDRDWADRDRRMLFSGSRERPRRRLSIDQNSQIPKELSLEKHSFILEQAEKQLHSGELSHGQHQELLHQLFELHQFQRQQQDDLFPQRPQFRKRPGDSRIHDKNRKSDLKDKDVDHRRFATQDVDERVFDVKYSTKLRDKEPINPAVKSAEVGLGLGVEDQDERKRSSIPKDRDDRVRVPPVEGQTAKSQLPLKSILKPEKQKPLLDSPLSPDPEEKIGSDSKVKTVGEAAIEFDEKASPQNENKEYSRTAEVDKKSPSVPVSEKLKLNEGGTDAEKLPDSQTKPKKKTKKKKKKGKGNEAEVQIEITAFEENLEIKPPTLETKIVRPLMDMDERRNTTDSETDGILPAPFREAHDVEELFPAGGDRDERRPCRPQSEMKRKPLPEEQCRTSVTRDKLDLPPRDPRLHKGPQESAENSPLRESYLSDYPPRDGIPREHPYQGTLTRENSSRNEPFRESPPREMLIRDIPPKKGFRESLQQEGPFRSDDVSFRGYSKVTPRDSLHRDGPFKEGPLSDRFLREGHLREGSFRDDILRDDILRDDILRNDILRNDRLREGHIREGPFRDSSSKGYPELDPRDALYRPLSRGGSLRGQLREVPFREGPPREGSFREGPLREGSFREGPLREGSFREGQPREGSFREGPPREGSFREGPPREGSFREGPPREGSFREGPPREGSFREGPLREGSLREGSPKEGSFREGLLRERSFREGAPRESSLRDGLMMERSFREGPPKEGSYRGLSREGSLREGPLREGFFRDDPFREGPSREGNFQDGQPRSRYFKEGPSRDGPHREGPFRGLLAEDPFRKGPLQEHRMRDDHFREGPNVPFGREQPLRDVAFMAGPARENRLREGHPGHGLLRDEIHGLRTALQDPQLYPQDGPQRDLDERWDKRHEPRLSGRNMYPEGIEGGSMQSKDRPLSDGVDKDERLQPAAVPQHPNIPQPGPRGPGPRKGVAFPMGTSNPMPVQREPLPLPLLYSIAGKPNPVMAQPDPIAQLQHSVTLNQGQLLAPRGINPSGMNIPGGVQLANPHHTGQLTMPRMLHPTLMGAPHLMRTDMAGTPPQQPSSAPLDVSSLLAKLVSTGILPSTARSGSPVVSGTETPPPTGKKTDDTGGDLTQIEEDLIVPELGLYPEELKCRYQGVINRIYTGTQCSSCGLRFVIDDMDRYRKHLDWHFRQNHREKDGVKAVQSRKWFYEIEQWMDYEESNDVEEERSTFFELRTAVEAPMDKDGVHCVAVKADVSGDEMCSLCHEAFEQFFDEDEEVWKLRDAIRFNNKTYHPACYEDAHDASLLEQPTPGDEGASSFFDKSFNLLLQMTPQGITEPTSVDLPEDSKNTAGVELLSAEELQTDEFIPANLVLSLDKEVKQHDVKLNTPTVGASQESQSLSLFTATETGDDIVDVVVKQEFDQQPGELGSNRDGVIVDEPGTKIAEAAAMANITVNMEFESEVGTELSSDLKIAIDESSVKQELGCDTDLEQVESSSTAPETAMEIESEVKFESQVVASLRSETELADEVVLPLVAIPGLTPTKEPTEEWPLTNEDQSLDDKLSEVETTEAGPSAESSEKNHSETVGDSSEQTSITVAKNTSDVPTVEQDAQDTAPGTEAEYVDKSAETASSPTKQESDVEDSMYPEPDMQQETDNSTIVEMPSEADYANEVTDIQQISVIGGTRILEPQRRRDMFFR